MFNILIVEDDKWQRNSLAKMIKEDGEVYNVFESENIDDALKISAENNIDLFYIDINLGNESGLNLALKIREINTYKLTWIVFITTHVKYMIEAFKDVHCYDYILKPYNKEKVKEITELLTNNTSTQQVNTFVRRFVVFDIEDVSIKVFLDEIIFIEVFIRTCYIYIKSSKLTLKNTSLKKIMEIINDDNFIQSHRSYIVNLPHIREIRKSLTKGEIFFNECEHVALLGEKFRKSVLNKFSMSASSNNYSDGAAYEQY